MADFESLLHAVDELSVEELERLYHHIRAELEAHRAKDIRESDRQHRAGGLHSHLGKAWMSEDFNAPLPDEFWAGYE